MQQILSDSGNAYNAIKGYLLENRVKKLLLVHGSSFVGTKPWKALQRLAEEKIIALAEFQGFTPNPDYEEVKQGVMVFHREKCDAIVAAGGGSCMDVAKCIKLFSGLDADKDFLQQEWQRGRVPFLAIPTTAGSGSEATRYAVIYRNGEKQSITSKQCIPDAVYFDAGLLSTIPVYQKKATMLDALCHSMESYWCVNSTTESMEYAGRALRLILDNYQGYLANVPQANENMLRAANLAGKAINISQTTAGHALCYQLTKRYGYAHGHAAALCDVWLWQYMYTHIDQCRDGRGVEYLEHVFAQLAEIWHCQSIPEGIRAFRQFVEALDLSHEIDETDIDELAATVNQQRLGNNPVSLDAEGIRAVYLGISKWQEK